MRPVRLPVRLVLLRLVDLDHQPVEHAATLRLIPNLDVWRPCDTLETAVAWAAGLQRKGPTALLLSRQNLPFAARASTEGVARGGYVLSDAENPRAVLIATGSEVQLALGAQKLLPSEGIPVRVVSMPSTSVFDRQPDDYRKSVLLEELPRIAVEAGVTDGEPTGCIFPFDLPRASLKQWIVALGAVALLMVALYFIFSALGL